MDSLLGKLLTVDLSKNRDKNRLILKEFVGPGNSAFKSAHNRPKAIWFYNFHSDKLEYSETAKGHRDRSAFSDEPFSGSEGWVRGRVFEKSGKYYIFIYMDTSIERNLLSRSIGVLYQQIQERFEYAISDIVDEDSRTLVASKKKR